MKMVRSLFALSSLLVSVAANAAVSDQLPHLTEAFRLAASSLGSFPSSFVASSTVSSTVSSASSLRTDPSLSQCCFYAGDGAGLSWGIGTFPIPGNDNQPGSYSVEIPIAIGSGSDAPGDQSIGVLIAPQGSATEDAPLGWYINQNKTAQTMYIWTNINNQPSCIVTSVPLPDYFVPGFNLCTGYASSLFPYYNRTYTVSSIGVNVFYQIGYDGNLQSTLRVTDDESCTPVGFSAPQNPFGTGSFTVIFEGGTNTSPQWKIPSFCPGQK